MKRIGKYNITTDNKDIDIYVFNSDRETYLDKKTMFNIIIENTRSILANINDDTTINKDNDNLVVSIEQINENTINVNILAAMTNDCIIDADDFYNFDDL
ncbi:hypothetical protein CACET_c27030 [Clostridium aceticum]|uniref:Uncharacterized protein n=1 Tax=Clostridium aceticum TaxID=84022 RepID=A0A0D8I971_9CLOT|nr:hypothetical protein [Clostridium aceticum]AKL96148.1 hypothetical protein CACET_c27030 [Clostridium aceticum]KJF26572.1 hypothetical protein TZ02_11890 [Clostridium aceticum]